MSGDIGTFRPFPDPEPGRFYRAFIAPMERKGGVGVDSRLNAVVVGAVAGEWVGPAPVYRDIALDSLCTEDLLKFLDEALERGKAGKVNERKGIRASPGSRQRPVRVRRSVILPVDFKLPRPAQPVGGNGSLP